MDNGFLCEAKISFTQTIYSCHECLLLSFDKYGMRCGIDKNRFVHDYKDSIHHDCEVINKKDFKYVDEKRGITIDQSHLR